MSEILHNVLLRDLAVVMIIAGVVTVICHRLKQPVVLGYILAGFIIGPHSPPASLITDENTIHAMAELGVVFLMFSLGLEFSLRKLRKVGFTGLITATLEVLLMGWVGFEIGKMFEWRTMDCLFLGAMLSMSSTTIIIKVLNEMGRGKEKFAQLIFGILIVEDILAIVMIALLSGIATTGGLATSDVLNAAGRLGVFLVVTLVLGLLTVPRLLGYVARFKSNEMLLVTVLGLCFGVSLLAVKLNYSVALGAFVIGAVIAEAREIHRIENLMEPIRDMFSAVFFVAVGLMIDPRLIVQYWLPIVIITVAVLLCKIVSDAFGVFISGHDTRTSLRVGMGLAQIGEFSFIIASLGLTLRVTSEFLYPIAVAVSLITTLLTPYLVQSSDGLVNWFDRVAPSRFVNYLAVYTRWVGQWREGRSDDMTSRLRRRWALQTTLNLVLVAGVFIAAAFVAEKNPHWLPTLSGGVEGMNAALWLAAILVSLPLLIATYRKLEAMGLLLGEMAAERLKNEPHAVGIQAIIAHTVLLAGVVGMGLLVLVLSAALLPSWRILVVLLLVVAAVAAMFWTSFIRLYSKAQIALEDTFAQSPPPRTEVPTPLTTILQNAQIEIVTIAATSPANGKLICELELRTRTGASVVAIERVPVPLINPGPDEELKTDDRVLLLGTHDQIAAARTLLNGD